MNKIFPYILLLTCLITSHANAQLSLSVNIVYPAPTYLSDWSFSRSGMANIVYTPAASQSLTIKFRTQIQNSDGNIIATSNNSSAAVYTLIKGANTFMLDQVLQLGNLQFSDGNVIRSIQTTGKLPPGDYQLCLLPLNSANDVGLLTSAVCRPFVQVAYQLPYLLSPNDNDSLDANIAQSVIIFRWSSIVPQPKESVIYRLQVFEVLYDQKPVQALRSNMPILNVEIRNTSQYFWRPQLSLKDSIAHVFIWTVQTLDSKGEPFPATDGNNLGRSEPRVFGVSNKLK